MTKEKVFKKILIGIAFGLAVSIVTPVSIPGEQIRVEAAKKDKKKPKIKLTGAKELTATVGEQVTIPATTYSDNKTKKKKLKVGVTVKKGNKNYKALASKIRKATLKSKPVSVTFGEEGTYKITTTVTDLSKNKATAVRTVTITPKQIEEQVITKQDPEVTTTTEQQKQEEPKREEKTTEEPKKEEAKTNVDLATSLSKYGTVESAKVNDIEYNFLKINSTSSNEYKELYNSEQSGTYSSDKMIVSDFGYDSTVIDYKSNHKYLEFFGNIKVIDDNGVDCSKTIFITERGDVYDFYYIDSNKNIKRLFFCIFVSYEFAKKQDYFNYTDESNKVCLNAEIFGKEYSLIEYGKTKVLVKQNI